MYNGQWKGESNTEPYFHILQKCTSCSHKISKCIAILKLQQPSSISCLLSFLQISYSCRGLQNESVRNEMFGTSWRKCSAKVIRKFLGRFPSHVALLTVHLILVPPPDSLHGSGGVRSCSGPQSRWVSHTLLCFPPFLYLCCYLEKCMHKILLGRHSCG